MPKVVYCEVCSLPPEYCRYNKKEFVHCMKWLKSKHPQIFNEFKETIPDVMKNIADKLDEMEKNDNIEQTKETQEEHKNDNDNDNTDNNQNKKNDNNNKNDKTQNDENNEVNEVNEVDDVEDVDEDVEDSESEDDLNKVEFIPMDDRYVKNVSSKRQQKRDGRNKQQNNDEDESEEENYGKLSRNQQRKLNYKNRKQQRQRNKNLKKNKSNYQNTNQINNSNQQSEIINDEEKENNNDNNNKKDDSPKKKIIQVGLALRRGKKKVTTVRGLMELGMKPKKAQTAFRKRFATGVGIDKKPTHTEIVIQGDVRYELIKFLREIYKVPTSKLYYALKNNRRERAIDNNGLIFPPP